MKMKRMTIILAALLGIATMPEVAGQEAKDILPGVSIGNFDMSRNGKYLTVEMDIDMTDLDVNTNCAVLLTPRLVNGADSIDLPSVGVYGRRRYYYYVRNGIYTISGETEQAYRAKEKPEQLAYNKPIVYEDWMDGATLKFHRSDWGCCQDILAEYEGILGHHKEAFFPALQYDKPKAEMMKSRSLSGSAYIDFPVDQTVIYPDYRRNTAELAKIQGTIDSVRNDKDITITSVWLKGFASPESPYRHNTDLAIGRTAALKKHIRQLYNFADDIIKTDYEPEDWAGLRRFVEQSNIDHRTEILALIDSDMEPDAKEWKIRRTYPGEYKFMLQNFYPALRHTDYRIDYTIRKFSRVDEIKRIMNERPQKLSLNEFYLLSQEYEEESEEYANVFETAVRMYPNDEVANLNAANVAMRRNNLDAAERYLTKAGNSPKAVYARGALAVCKRDYATARQYMNKAKEMGMEQAATVLEDLDYRQGNKNGRETNE